MSPIQEIVNLAVQAYFQHYSTAEQSTLLATDPSLAAESSKDLMIKVLESARSLVNEEITKRTTDLKRRRNQVHASIYQLPHEIFAEILAIAGSATSNISKTLTLMRVSKYWCDTLTKHPHIRLRVDVAQRLEPEEMTIVRVLRGPIEIECLQEPSDLNGSLADLASLDPTRFQMLRWYYSPRTEALHSFFQKQNSNFIDLAVKGDTRPGISRRLELSPEGRCLRHVDLRNIALPWASPRLSQLQTLALEGLNRGEDPSVDDLYRILSLSPALRRIRLQYIQNAVQEDPLLPTIKEPLFLPVLRTLHFSGSTSNVILPLLRAPSCRVLSASVRVWAPSKSSDAILDLITSPMASQSTMFVKVQDTEGDLSVLLRSYLQKPWIALGEWGDRDTGISVRLIPLTVEGLRTLFDGLISRLQAARWRPDRLTLELDMPRDASGAQMVLPILCRFPLTFDTITYLSLMSQLPSTHSSALRLLEDGIPKLTRLETWTEPNVPCDTEEWANGIKAFLERRHPLHTQDTLNALQQLSRLSSIHVPNKVAKCLRRDPPATSLSMSELLKGAIY
ncbi:hypothetical protein FRC01_010502 [Tulasnella sp. 417]|nr:hypothetical protein FRC01_010502 [Tulasnella sp. 417]